PGQGLDQIMRLRWYEAVVGKAGPARREPVFDPELSLIGWHSAHGKAETGRIRRGLARAAAGDGASFPGACRRRQPTASGTPVAAAVLSGPNPQSEPGPGQDQRAPRAMIDIRKLKELVKLMVENDLSELDLQDQQETVTIKRRAGEPPAISAGPAPGTAAALPPSAGGAGESAAGADEAAIGRASGRERGWG